jgi:diadenosine tetraphosphatase ApaH/serine/threonine PP2A family protein phosphatase
MLEMIKRGRQAPASLIPLSHLLPDLSRNRGHGLPAKRRVLEHIARIAAHKSPRTNKLYNRTHDEISLDEVGRISIWNRSSLRVR